MARYKFSAPTGPKVAFHEFHIGDSVSKDTGQLEEGAVKRFGFRDNNQPDRHALISYDQANSVCVTLGPLSDWQYGAMSQPRSDVLVFSVATQVERSVGWLSKIELSAEGDYPLTPEQLAVNLAHLALGHTVTRADGATFRFRELESGDAWSEADQILVPGAMESFGFESIGPQPVFGAVGHDSVNARSDAIGPFNRAQYEEAIRPGPPRADGLDNLRLLLDVHGYPAGYITNTGLETSGQHPLSSYALAANMAHIVFGEPVVLQ